MHLCCLSPLGSPQETIHRSHACRAASAGSEEGFAIESEKFVSLSGVSFTSSARRTERNSWPWPNLGQYPGVCVDRLKRNVECPC
jgi:hypothetical protein